MDGSLHAGSLLPAEYWQSICNPWQRVACLQAGGRQPEVREKRRHSAGAMKGGEPESLIPSPLLHVRNGIDTERGHERSIQIGNQQGPEPAEPAAQQAARQRHQ